MRAYKVAVRKAKMLLLEASGPPPVPAPAMDPRPEMICFRGQTLAIVRHFFELSCQVGRLPSLLGREFFRSRISHHSIPSFEEQTVFVRDVELCLARLNEEQAEIITLVALYDFSYEEVGSMLHCSPAGINRHFLLAIDSLSEIFLQAKLIFEERPDRRQRQSMTRCLPADIFAPERKPPAAA